MQAPAMTAAESANFHNCFMEAIFLLCLSFLRKASLCTFLFIMKRVKCPTPDLIPVKVRTRSLCEKGGREGEVEKILSEVHHQ